MDSSHQTLLADGQKNRLQDGSHLPLQRPRLARLPGQWGGSIRGTTADDFSTLSSDPVDAIQQTLVYSPAFSSWRACCPA